MKPPQDPPRLLDPGSDAPEWLRASLEVGARDLPGPERLARIAAGLPSGPTGSGPSAPRSPSAPSAPAIPTALSGAAIGAALGLAVVGAGWFVSSRAPDGPPPARPALSAAIAAPVAEPLDLEPAKMPAPRSRSHAERPDPLPSGAASPRASAGLEPADAGAESLPAVAASDPPAAESESAILQRAQDALRASPSRALSLTDLHLARFPGGALAQEREVLAVSALLGMGRAAEARARATRFIASFPASAHRRRLEVLIPDLESSSGAHKERSDRPSTP